MHKTIPLAIMTATLLCMIMAVSIYYGRADWIMNVITSMVSAISGTVCFISAEITINNRTSDKIMRTIFYVLSGVFWLLAVIFAIGTALEINAFTETGAWQ